MCAKGRKGRGERTGGSVCVCVCGGGGGGGYKRTSRRAIAQNGVPDKKTQIFCLFFCSFIFFDTDCFDPPPPPRPNPQPLSRRSSCERKTRSIGERLWDQPCAEKETPKLGGYCECDHRSISTIP